MTSRTSRTALIAEPVSSPTSAVRATNGRSAELAVLLDEAFTRLPNLVADPM